jgi:putative intracellular protease/amidase
MPETPNMEEKAALAKLKTTLPLSEVADQPYAGIFFAGGHGTMFDFPTDSTVQSVVSEAVREDLPLALVCHGPAALVGASLSNGDPVAKGRQVTGFTNEEEVAVELDDEMPFLLETRLKEQGAAFIGAEKFTAHVVVDGNLITGQNPPSSQGAAEALMQRIKASK